MMSRRFVNLAMADYNNHIFSLHRLDVSKHLFYPSTAEAEAAAGDRVDKPEQGKPPKIRKLRLPQSIMGFEPFSTRDSFNLTTRYDCNFVLLHGPCGRSTEAGRILFTNSEGQATMYDLDSRSVISVPDHSVLRGGCRNISMVTTSPWKESLYVMRGGGGEPFQVLEFSGNVGDKSRTTYSMYGSSSSSSSLRWKALPPLPKALPRIQSFTVVDGGRIICVSSGGWMRDEVCFDTVSQEWWRSGDDWALPFEGRAEYVPELDTWLGFSNDYTTYNHLSAADLSSVAMAPRQAPTLQHVWEDYNPPPREEKSLVLNKNYGIVLRKAVDWTLMERFLINLGSGRFCVAKILDGERSVSLNCSFDKVQEEALGEFTVLIGVEVIPDVGDGGLRMVKHKSRQLVYPGLDVACVL